MAEQSFFDKVSSHAAHVPDVLSCIANLSNDEVFPPPEVVNKMLDLLPQELFANPDTTFLDPATKTGVFLREIAKRCLAAQLPGYAERSAEITEKKALGIPLDEYDIAFQKQLQDKIDHIFHKQLFGIGITELTSLLARRSVYCSKYPNGPYSITHFDDAEGNIRFRRTEHTWGKITYDANRKPHQNCIWCGASKDQYDRDKELESHAYEFIHVKNPEDIFKMKFDVIISNPPYQLSDGGSGPSASPLYHKFVSAAKQLSPRYITMIIPSRWFAGGKGLDEFRADMLNDDRISTMVDYVNSADCFTGVDIAGGVNYFLWDSNHHGSCRVTTVRGQKQITADRVLNEFDIFVRSNESLSIIDKVKSKAQHTLEEYAFSRNPFGFESKARGISQKDGAHPVKLVHSQGCGYVKESDVKKNADHLDRWKISIGKLVPSNGEVGVDPSKGYNAMTQPRILSPYTVITDSYLVLATFKTENEANNFVSFMTLKFPRFLMHETYSSMNISKSNFRFVPFMDFTRAWTDAELYDYFDLTEDEIAFVEGMIRPMELDPSLNA